MRLPYSPLPLLGFIFLLGVLVALVQVGLLALVFGKLGLSASSGFALLFASLFGSAVNVPLFTLRASAPALPPLPPPWRGLLRPAPRPFTGRTRIAVNVGGCLIPLAFSGYLLQHRPMSWPAVLTGVTMVAFVSRLLSRPIGGIGIGMPMLVAPVTAAVIALLLDPVRAAPLAYVSGTLGVLLGADLLRLNDIRRLGTPFASLGGAGTFDGIFLTGVVAVLLA